MKDCPEHPCIQYACIEGVCHPFYLKGASCSDGDKCNGDELCDEEGQCLPGTPIPVDDGKVCTIDSCDPATGTVSHKGEPGCTCETNADCDDNNACTIDVCKLNGTGQKTCFYTNANAGTECDDKNKCTIGDKCDTGGKCQGSLIPVDDGNPCTADSCDPATGQPVHKGNVGQPCSDNNTCTIYDACDAKGKCEGFALDPDDNNPCTVDLCDPITGNFIYKGVAGCKSCEGKDSDCDDGNPCTVDTCKVDICDYQDVPPGGGCDDGNACTLGDKCNMSGKCVGSLKNVDDGNPCTADFCDPATGNPIYAPAPGQSCTDDNLCTLGDLCNEQGQCVGINKSVDDANECTTDTCDPATGNVSHTPQPNCKPCTVAADCNDSNPCTTDSCQAGKCAYANAASGTTCSDNNLCTDNDKCNGSGQCVGTPKTCNSPPNDPQCHNSPGTCDPSNGDCSYTPKPKGASCDDGNICTTKDECNGIGACVGSPKCNSPPSSCYHSPGNCHPFSGLCEYIEKNKDTPCDDGDDCTANDFCDQGDCTGYYICP